VVDYRFLLQLCQRRWINGALASAVRTLSALVDLVTLALATVSLRKFENTHRRPLGSMLVSDRQPKQLVDKL